MAKSVKTVSTAQIISSVGESVNATLKEKDLSLPKKVIKDIVNAFLDVIVESTVSGHKVRIDSLGILQVKARKARMGRNPQTGEEIKIPASKKVAFRVAKSLKEKVVGVKKPAKERKTASKKKK